MATRFAEGPEVEFGDPSAAKVTRRRPWTLGRIVTYLAIVMVAVPLGTNFLAGPRIGGECGTTLDNFALAAGFWILAAKVAWIPLKALNDAGERWLDALTARDPDKNLNPWTIFDAMTRSARPVAVGLVQMRCSTDPVDNLRRACEFLREAADRGAKVACLPELFRSRYFCQVEDHKFFDLAEPIPGETTEALSEVARETRMAVIGSMFERRAAGIYHNTAVVFDVDGSIAGRYRKMHIPDDPLYYEKFYFTPGDLGFQAIATEAATVGPLVCWDQWYPEAARLTALKGAEILFYPTAIGWHPSEKAEFGEAQADAWQTMQRAHAISNGVYVMAINRIGHEGPPEGGIEFWGGTFAADPFGRVIARASLDREEVLIVECDPALVEDTRRHWPFLRDRRIDAYGSITQRFSD